MTDLLQLTTRILLSLLLSLSALWCSLVIWYLLPVNPASVRITGAIIWCGFAGWSVFRLWRQQSLKTLLPYTTALLVLLGGWLMVTPSHNRIWADDVAQMLQSDIQGNLVTLHNVRNFDWRTETDYTVNWETRQYDLSQLQRVDMALSYWMGPAIAHTLVSFGFSDGRYLTFSIEIRKEQGESFSAVGGFFKQFETSLIAADERDILYVRTNARGEDVYLYNVNMAPADIRSLFLAYLKEAEQLRHKPRFYNTITENCTTIVFRMVQRIVQGLPVDYRLLASGYLPEYLYDVNGLPAGYTMEQLRTQGRITERALAYGNGENFSEVIRQGIPQN
ncbi:DUF4105 domain-containing protein [Chromatiaceae bacterium AAb-1]|nr:DUF4105 domain-containing protein [Chromatiaceae bacterium AAb-1]